MERTDPSWDDIVANSFGGVLGFSFGFGWVVSATASVFGSAETELCAFEFASELMAEYPSLRLPAIVVDSEVSAVVVVA